jgi:hypothetical protein
VSMGVIQELRTAGLFRFSPGSLRHPPGEEYDSQALGLGEQRITFLGLNGLVL